MTVARMASALMLLLHILASASLGIQAMEGNVLT